MTFKSQLHNLNFPPNGDESLVPREHINPRHWVDRSLPRVGAPKSNPCVLQLSELPPCL